MRVTCTNLTEVIYTQIMYITILTTSTLICISLICIRFQMSKKYLTCLLYAYALCYRRSKGSNFLTLFYLLIFLIFELEPTIFAVFRLVKTKFQNSKAFESYRTNIRTDGQTDGRTDGRTDTQNANHIGKVITRFHLVIITRGE